MKIDIEQLKLIKELLASPHQNMGEIVPVHPAKDRDSFAEFTGGLRQNWVFVIALFSIGFWLISNTFEIQNQNQQQDTRIESTETAILNLNKQFETFEQETGNSLEATSVINNEIIRKLDALQKDIEVIKGK